MTNDERLSILRDAMNVLGELNQEYVGNHVAGASCRELSEAAGSVLCRVVDAVEELRSMETNAVSADDYLCCNCGGQVTHNGGHYTGDGIKACTRGCHEALSSTDTDTAAYAAAGWDCSKVPE
jgi:hypothetical protein